MWHAKAQSREDKNVRAATDSAPLRGSAPSREISFDEFPVCSVPLCFKSISRSAAVLEVVSRPMANRGWLRIVRRQRSEASPRWTLQFENVMRELSFQKSAKPRRLFSSRPRCFWKSHDFYHFAARHVTACSASSESPLVPASLASDGLLCRHSCHWRSELAGDVPTSASCRGQPQTSRRCRDSLLRRAQAA